MNLHQGPIAVANIPRNQEKFLSFCKNVEVKLTGNTSLPNPTPSVAVYAADVKAFDDASVKAQDGAPTAIADRDVKALKVYQDIGHIVDYTQSVADQQVSPADAIAVILSAGLDVRKTGGRKKPPLEGRYTGLSGEVLLLALAIAGAGAYFWEFSVDQKVWSMAPETKKSRTTITGLTPGVVYSFRFRALTDKGKGEYSPIISLMVH